MNLYTNLYSKIYFFPYTLFAFIISYYSIYIIPEFIDMIIILFLSMIVYFIFWKIFFQFIYLFFDIYIYHYLLHIRYPNFLYAMRMVPFALRRSKHLLQMLTSQKLIRMNNGGDETSWSCSAVAITKINADLSSSELLKWMVLSFTLIQIFIPMSE